MALFFIYILTWLVSFLITYEILRSQLALQGTSNPSIYSFFIYLLRISRWGILFTGGFLISSRIKSRQYLFLSALLGLTTSIVVFIFSSLIIFVSANLLLSNSVSIEYDQKIVEQIKDQQRQKQLSRISTNVNSLPRQIILYSLASLLGGISFTFLKRKTESIASAKTRNDNPSN